MYYNVVIKNGFDNEQHDELVFCFGNNYKEVIEFIKLITRISDYYVEFLQFKEKEKEK